jgi:hypothetical protein
VAEAKNTRRSWKKAIRSVAPPLTLLAASMLLIFGGADAQLFGFALVGMTLAGSAL